MFKNRSIRVQLEKTPKGDASSLGTESTEEKVIIMTDSAKALMYETMKMVAFYVALDTARKVLITLASK